IESLEVLHALLEQYSGGLLFISHDRYFIAQHAKTLYWLTRQRLVLMGTQAGDPASEVSGRPNEP
ncbi:MAG: hypothetical protein PHX90_06790, partial [Thermotogota bacterium]|nr:hypothetical protein [Thermotogota bacterium]